MILPDHILLFDGVCNLCNRTVGFIIRNDPAGIFKFASLQSEKGQEILKLYGLPEDQINFIIFIREGKLYKRSTAVLLVLKDLGGIWKLFYSLIIVPPFIRDFLYNLIAKRRYHLFGKRSVCMVPSTDIKDRFLE